MVRGGGRGRESCSCQRELGVWRSEQVGVLHGSVSGREVCRTELVDFMAEWRSVHGRVKELSA